MGYRTVLAICFGLYIPTSFCRAQVVDVVEVAERVVSVPEGEILIGPDPESLPSIDLVRIISQPFFRRVAGIGNEEAKAIRELEKGYDSRMQSFYRTGVLTEEIARRNLQEAEVLLQTALAEILTPDTLQRVKQTAYRLEIESIGWKNSLLYGNLSKRVDVYPGQEQDLEDEISAAIVEMEEKVRKAKLDAEERILRALTPEQRKAAQKAIGPFVFVQADPSTLAKKRRDERMDERIKEAEEDAKNKK